MKWTQEKVDDFNYKKAGTTLIKNPGIIVGIDPDTEKSGVCEWNRGNNDLKLFALTFFKLFEYLSANRLKIDLVKIEAGWKNSKSNFHGAKNNRTAAKIGLNVGANQQTGKKIVEMCEYLGIPFKEVKPLRKVWKGGKISHVELIGQFKKRGLNIEGRTNQESRDAALICLNG